MFCYPLLTGAQALEFDGARVDTITIRHSQGYYHFDTCGTYTGIDQVYVIALDTVALAYQVPSYTKETWKSTFKPSALSLKKKKLRKGKKPDIENIRNLLLQFDLHRSMTSYSQCLNMPAEDFLGSISKTMITEQADGRPVYNKITYAEFEKRLQNCIYSKDSLEHYLQQTFDTNAITVVTDMHNDFKVTIRTAKTVYTFFSDAGANRQPWHYAPVPKGILNFSITPCISALVPRSFPRPEPVNLQFVKEEYIRWCIDRLDSGGPFNTN